MPSLGQQQMANVLQFRELRKRSLLMFIVDINECDSDPCLNSGQCQNLLAAFHCECPVGWTGVQCEAGKSKSQLTLELEVKLHARLAIVPARLCFLLL